MIQKLLSNYFTSPILPQFLSSLILEFYSVNISVCHLVWTGQQAMVMLRIWLNTQGNKATGNALEKALRRIYREGIVNKCIFNVELVTDEMEQSAAQAALADQSGFDSFKVLILYINLFVSTKIFNPHEVLIIISSRNHRVQFA